MSTATTELTIEAQVKQIFTDAGWDRVPHMSVKACETGGSAWRRGVPNGMYSIDIWGAKTYSKRDRDHMFRTKKDGTFSADTLTKIKEFATYRLASVTSAETAAQAREVAKQSNAVIADQLRKYAETEVGSYYSSYPSQSGGYITEDSGQVGKVKINVGALLLTEAQTKQLLELVASFKK